MAREEVGIHKEAAAARVGEGARRGWLYRAERSFVSHPSVRGVAATNPEGAREKRETCAFLVRFARGCVEVNLVATAGIVLS